MQQYRHVSFLFGIISFALILFYIAQKQITDSVPASVYILAPADVQELNQSSAETIPIFSPTIDSNFFSTIVSSVIVSPQIAQTGAVSRYEVEYLAQKSLYPGGTITVQFPFEFGFADGCPIVLRVPDNSDLNGFSPGEPAVDAIVCDAFMKTAKVRVKNDPIRQGDTVHFLLDGIQNSSTALGYSSAGYTASIQTQDHAGNYLESLISLPFFLEQAGTQTISGTIFKDDGFGTLGTPGDGIQNGDETGVANIQVCLSGSHGYLCQTTSGSGRYRFEQLKNGFYSISVQPPTSGTLVGGPFFQSIELENGSNVSGVDFGFTSPNRTLTAAITNIPATTSIDVFAFNTFATDGGGYVLRELSWNGNSSRTIDLPISDGYWEIGVGPALSKDPLAANTTVFDFSFMSPKSKQVYISGADEYRVEFALQAVDKQIKGKVVNGSGVGIPNAYVYARPAVLTDEAGRETSTQSRADGTFILKVTEGVYSLDAYLTGLPPSGMREVTVKADTDAGGLDGNVTADVYSEGVRITNDGDGGKGNLLFKVNTRDRSITGRVLDESSQPIIYAFVGAEAIDNFGNPIGDWSDSPTDTTGKFTLFVNDGRWKVRAFDSRYGEVGAKTIVVAGANMTGQDIQSPPTFGTVTGTVKKNGISVAGVFVSVFGPDGGNGAVTDKDGSYAIKVKAGSGYTIEGFLPGVGDTSTISSVTVTAGATLTGKNLSIETPGTIAVSISGVTDAYVNAFSSAGRGNGTNANPTPGLYSLAIPAGTYTVTANSIQYGLLGEKSSVRVTGGSTTTVAFLPPQSFTVSGNVISNSAICKNGAFISLSDIKNGRVLIKTTDTSGGYSLSVPNGSYLMSASKPGCVEKDKPTTITVNGANVTSNTNRSLALPVSSIVGRVLLSNSNTTLETVVTADSSDGRTVSTIVDTTKNSGNNYTISLAEGTWTLRARSDGYESSSKTITIAAGDTQTAHLTLSPIAGFVKTERVYTSVKPSQGGVVKDSNVGDNFALTIPAGALGSSTNSGSIGTKVTTAVVEKTSTAQVVGGKGIEITPKDSSGKPITTLSTSGSAGVTVTVPYSESDVITLGIDESKLVLATWSAEKMQWEPLATTVNTEKNTLTASAQHFSVFAPIVPAEKVVAPEPTPQPSATSQEVATPSPATVVPVAPLGTALPPQSVKSPSAAQSVPKQAVEPAKQVPITPSVRSERVTTVMETRGGVISVSIPPQAVRVPATLAVVPIQTSDMGDIASFPKDVSSAGNMIYDITLRSDEGGIVSQLDEPAAITLSYTDDQIARLEEDTLTIQFWDRVYGQWVPLLDNTLDAAANTVSATTKHFTLFAIAGTLKGAAVEPDKTQQTKQRLTKPVQKHPDIKPDKQEPSRKDTPPLTDTASSKLPVIADTAKPQQDAVQPSIDLFDVSVSTPEQYNLISKGQSVVAQIKIDSGKPSQNHDIAVHYVVQNSQGTNVITEQERVSFEGKTAFVKSFVVPSEQEAGRYRIIVRLPDYDTQASTSFTIRSSDWGMEASETELAAKIDQKPKEGSTPWMTIVLVGIFAFIAALTLVIRKKKS
ncbi:hypothetical protein HY622_01415 [Candidatus Uhrbacteria bacterium]|nr:hypothetical protein [Candidatus Uhrbacteria bacterium]